MYTKKTLNIFDKEAISIGSFITFRKVEKDYDYEDGAVWNDTGVPLNGIINVVNETYIEVATINKTYQLFIHQIMDSPAFDGNPPGGYYRILGIIPNAIK